MITLNFRNDVNMYVQNEISVLKPDFHRRLIYKVNKKIAGHFSRAPQANYLLNTLNYHIQVSKHLPQKIVTVPKDFYLTIMRKFASQSSSFSCLEIHNWLPKLSKQNK